MATGRDHYVEKYRSALTDEANWLSMASRMKVDSVQRLLEAADLRPETMAELGCGPGEVIGECSRRGLAKTYFGVDYSVDALDHARTRWPLVTFERLDLSADRPPWAEPLDVVIVSHVIEHLEQPELLLRRIPEFGRFAILEVPLEDLLASRLKNWFRDRRANAAGHVAWYSGGSFARLLWRCDLEIVGQRTYFPRLPLRRVWGLGKGWSLAWKVKVTFTGWLLPTLFGPLWTALYMANHAVLVRSKFGALAGGKR
jgi:SAM-dependent methyltransferase